MDKTTPMDYTTATQENDNTNTMKEKSKKRKFKIPYAKRKVQKENFRQKLKC